MAEGAKYTVKSKARTRIWSMEKMRVSVKDGQIKVNENEGEKTSGTWRVRCHNRAGEAVTHTCTALLSGERPRLLCRPHLINPFALVNIPPLTLPQLSTLFHFHYSPLEPVRQTLRDYTIITLFPHRLELLPELVWSDPPPPTGTTVAQVTATDADDPMFGNNAKLIYSILQGEPYFSVEPKTGTWCWQI